MTAHSGAVRDTALICSDIITIYSYYMPAGQLQVSEIKGTDIGSDFLTGKTGTVTWHVLHSAVPKGCHNDFEVTENLLPSGLTVWSEVFGE